MKSKTKYMHTINGKPGLYIDQQICYADNHAITLAENISQIKSERTASLKWRKEQGFKLHFRYGYVRVKT